MSDISGLLLRMQTAIPGTCDWGDCDNNALLARFDADNGWLPVCQWHAADASSADLAPITALAFEAEWERLAALSDGVAHEERGLDAIELLRWGAEHIGGDSERSRNWNHRHWQDQAIAFVVATPEAAPEDHGLLAYVRALAEDCRTSGEASAARIVDGLGDMIEARLPAKPHAPAPTTEEPT